MPSLNQSTRVQRFGIALAIVFFALILIPRAASAQNDEGFKNLKVLHKDITKDELMGIMKSFTQALGVRCEHCHVEEEQPGQRPRRDFASDEKEPKRTARLMLQMVNDINTNDLAKIEDRGDDPLRRVTCATCHRGHQHPETIEQALDIAYTAGGIDSAMATYRTLRGEYYGGAGFDFTVGSLNRFASQLSEEKKYDEALTALNVNAEFNPESDQIEVFKALTYWDKGDSLATIEHLQKALEINPENRWAKRTLGQLTGEAPAGNRE